MGHLQLLHPGGVGEPGTPPFAPALFYQVDDGTGQPPLIRMVKRVSAGDVSIEF